jgi:hypothetical protein
MIDQDIQRRMDAYRGNPQALMQRYQQNQQLIDLLALQKLKSEKEAAARSLQMATAQGQGEPPTVAQQREQEVMGLTQQEVARSVGAEAQQRAAREQEAMQSLLQGIAAAPGAENAMPARAMAAGGIVAFQSGGTASAPSADALGQDVDEIRRQLTEARRKLLTYGTRQQKADPEGYAQAKRSVEELTAKERSLASSYGAQISGGIAGPITSPLRPPAPVQPAAAPSTPDPTFNVPSPEEFAAMEAVAPSQALPREAPPQAPPTLTPTPALTAAPTPQPEGIAAALPQLQRPGAPGLQNALEQEVLRGLTRDPMEMARLRQSMIPGLNQERMAARQKGLAELEKTYAEENDPKRRLLRDLTAFFLGGAGRSSNAAALAGGAQGYLQSSDAQQAAQRARMKELEAAREGIRALEEGRELEGAKAGLTGLAAADEARRAALTAGSGMTSSERTAAAGMYGAELQAQVSRLNEQSRALDRALARGDLDLRTAQAQYTAITTRRGQLREQAEKRLDADKPMDIKLIEMKPNKTAEDLGKLRNYEVARNIAVQRALSETDRALAAVEAKLGIPSAPASAAPRVDTSGFRITGVK